MQMASLLARPCYPQVVMQLGYPAHAARPTRRRPLADVIESAAVS